MKTEWKVLASLIALLLLMEVGVRAFETKLSKDLTHLRQLPLAAESLKTDDAYKILIVGNSLARYGIDRKLLVQGLEGKGYEKIRVEAFHPDGTTITEWSYGLRRYFLNPGAIPDRIIVVSGRTHLMDIPPKAERLGAFYVDLPDVKEAVLLELNSVEERARFFLARASGLFANRSRIQPYVFYNYLPEYTGTIQDINDQRKMLAEKSSGDAKMGTADLGRFLEVAQSKGSKISVVAIPMLASYDLPNEISKEIEKQGGALWDLSGINEIDEKNFFDGYHLDPEGAVKVTEALIEHFPKINTSSKL